MTGPKRWLETPGEGPDEAVRLLAAGRRARPPRPEELGKTAAVLAGLGAASAAKAAVGVWLWVGLGAAAVGGVVTAVALLGEEGAPPRVPAPSVPRPAWPGAPSAHVPEPSVEPAVGSGPGGEGSAADAATASTASNDAAAAGAGDRASPPASPRALPAEDRGTPPSVDSIAEESAMLEAARALLDTDPVAALARAEEHRRRFRAGLLAPEREVIAIDALVRAGRRSEASRRADALLRRSPSSLYADRVRQLLER